MKRETFAALVLALLGPVGCVVGEARPSPASPAPPPGSEPAPLAVTEPDLFEDTTIFVSVDGGCSTRDDRDTYTRGSGVLQLASNADACANLRQHVERELAAHGAVVVADRDVPHQFVAEVSMVREVVARREGGRLVTRSQTVVLGYARVILQEDGATAAVVERHLEAQGTDPDRAMLAAELVEGLMGASVLARP